MSRAHWFPEAPRDRRPSPLWYAGWAAYVNRFGYRGALWKVLALGTALGLAGVLLERPVFFALLAGLAALSAAVFLYSLAGIYRMYGPPARGYTARLLEMGEVPAKAVLADLHLGSWRTSHLLAELRPQATLHSIDCWDYERPCRELNVQQLHELEGPPGAPPFATARMRDGRLPLEDASCDAVVAGFGLHELPLEGPLEGLLDEARRVLRPGGSMLLFEHLVDAENFVIFGPGIGHWPRRSDWLGVLRLRFHDVRHVRAPQAVDLFAGRR